MRNFESSLNPFKEVTPVSDLKQLKTKTYELLGDCLTHTFL
jgi:hypothetical protein